MTKTVKNSKIDAFIKKAKTWQKEIEKLRAIILEYPLVEELKWGKPCYAYEGHNVVVILPLKNYCTLLFCKGALLDDANGLLVKAGENTQAARQVRFTSLREIDEKKSVLKGYIGQAVEAEKNGLQVTFKKITEWAVPAELQRKLDQSPALKTAFEALTPGRQRAYYMHFAAPKQSKTRESRVEKCIPQILKGKGMNDR